MFERELLKNKEVEEDIKNSLIASQQAFANQIKNGYGENIRKELKNPEKPSVITVIVVSIKKIFRKLIEIC